MDSDDFRAIFIGLGIMILQIGVGFVVVLGIIKLVKYCWFF